MAETQTTAVEQVETLLEQAQETTAQPSRPKERISNPVFKQTLTINTLQAQRVIDRVFWRTARSLFSIDVILRIIGEQEAIDQVENVILGLIGKVSKDMDKATERLQKAVEDNGIDETPSYTHPVEHTIEITSPQVAEFAHLIRKLDHLVGLADTLWLNRLLPSQQRIDDNYRWQQRLMGLASNIIGIERRARDYARNKGMEREIEEVVPEEAPEETEEKAGTEEATESSPEEIEDEADTGEKVAETEEESGRFFAIKRLVNQ